MTQKLGNLFIDGEGSSIIDITGRHIINNSGSISISNIYKKYGQSSLAFTMGETLSIPNHDDFNFGTGNFTIDFWVISPEGYSSAGLFNKQLPSQSWPETSFAFRIVRDGLSCEVGGPNIILESDVMDTTLWHHIALIRNINRFSLYLNGVEVAFAVSSTSVNNISAPFVIGNAYTVYHRGNIDNFRIIKGEALWTSNFELTEEALFYKDAVIPPEVNSYVRPDSIKGLYDITKKAGIRNAAKNGFIRPTLSEMFMTHREFVEVVSTTIPEAPTIGTVTLDNGSAVIPFTAPAEDGNSPILYYTATSTPGGLTGTLNQAGSGTITMAGLTLGVSYTFKITATNIVGTSLESEDSNSVLPVSVPGAPTIGTVTINDTTASVPFTAPVVNGGSVITSYTATSTPGGLTGVLNQSGSGTIMVSGLTNGTSYTFKVKATNSVGTGTESAASNTIVPTFTLLRTLNNPNPYGSTADDWLGYAVAVCQSYSIVSAAQERVDGFDYVGKVYIFNNTTGVLLHTLNNPNAYGTIEGDFFGRSVAICESYSIVGAFQEDDSNGTNSGKAYIFSNSTGALLHTLNNPNPYGTSGMDNFGRSVAVCESYSIVGAFQEDEAGGNDSGKAYIFSNSTGALLYTLNNPNAYGTSGMDNFGLSVAICESYSIVTALNEDDAGGTDSGKAYIFSNSTGNLLFTLSNPNAYGTSTNDYFGKSVAICESYSIVGTDTEDDVDSIVSSGKAYIFSNTTGALLRTLNNPNAYGTPTSDQFGISVAICESYSIVGAQYEDDINGTSSGKAYIFSNSTGALLHTLNNPNPYGTSASDYFSRSVGICETYAIVGAHYEDDDTGLNSGKAYIFKNSDGALLYTLSNSSVYGGTYQEYFGYSMAICPTYSIVGAYNEDDAAGSNSGKVYIYNNLTGALLLILNNPNAYSTSANDSFGYSVAICESFSIAGAHNESGSSGKAYVFNNSTGNLLFTLDNPNAYDTPAGDNFGKSVAISESYIAVSALHEGDSGGTRSGKVYIFSTSTGALLRTINNPNPYGTSAYDYFGNAMAVSEPYLIIGSYAKEDESGNSSGKAYIYNITTGALLHTLNNPNPYGTSQGDYFGQSVAICPTYSIVGADGEDENADQTTSGKAYIFSNSTGALLHTLNNPNAYGTPRNDYFGTSVAICESYSIVSANLEGEFAGTAGSSSGKVYVFSNTTGALLKTLNNPNAYSTHQSDRFGFAVAASNSYVLAGASTEDDEHGTDSGKVYVFKI